MAFTKSVSAESLYELMRRERAADAAELETVKRPRWAARSTWQEGVLVRAGGRSCSPRRHTRPQRVCFRSPLCL